ncbi:MAG: hypothetical protein ACLUTY_13110 [Waltera sp.]
MWKLSVEEAAAYLKDRLFCGRREGPYLICVDDIAWVRENWPEAS